MSNVILSTEVDVAPQEMIEYQLEVVFGRRRLRLELVDVERRSQGRQRMIALWDRTWSVVISRWYSRSV